MIKLALVLVLAVLIAGCTTSSSVQSGDVKNSDGSITKQDGTMVKTDGTMIKPDGTMIAPDGTMIKPDGSIVEPEETTTKPDTESAMEKEDVAMSDDSLGFTGQAIAGSTTPYIRFSRADFDTAKAENKAVYVYYYATWCPICKSERPNILEAFDSFSLPNAVGFEAHWNDGQNTPEDDAFARENGVSYQHTHLFFDKTGNLAEKTLESLSSAQIQAKLAALV